MLADHAPVFPRARRVHMRERLVEDERARVHRQRARDSEAVALAVAEFCRARLLAMRDVERGQQPFRVIAIRAAFREMLAHRAVRPEPVALRHPRHSRLAVQFSAGGFFKSREQVQQRSLSRAGCAEHRGDAVRHDERNVAQASLAEPCAFEDEGGVSLHGGVDRSVRQARSTVQLTAAPQRRG